MMEASSRQVLAMAKGFYELGYIVTTVCENKYDLGNITKYKHECFVVKGIDEDKSLAQIEYERIISENKYNLILPLSDFSAEIASINKERWESSYGCKVAIQKYDAFIKVFDKLNTMAICMENEIPCPETKIVEDIRKLDPNKMDFPVVMKPRSACGSIGFRVISNKEEYIKFSKKVINKNYLIQEYIPQNGKQFNAHFFMDQNHKVKMAICTEKCRWFPIDGGASTLCRTIVNQRIIDDCTKLLKKIGWVGYCDIDLIEDKNSGVAKIIEINGRISANVKICFDSGINVSKKIDELYFKDDVHQTLNYKSDVRLRCIHTDLLWYMYKLKEGNINTDPCFWDFSRTKDQIFSFMDPLPFIVFSIRSLFRFRSEMKKRKRKD